MHVPPPPWSEILVESLPLISLGELSKVIVIRFSNGIF